MTPGKLIIVSAPSGCGKSTIISALRERARFPFSFSVSATNRPPRQGEIDGVNYHFLSDDDFRNKISGNQFVEYEEVYPGRYYGTLKSEIEDRLARGENVILDLDVKGGVNVKNMYGDRALSLFIQPPSVDALRQRLQGRGSETPETLADRLGRAELELSFAPRFDHVVVNDVLAQAVDQTEKTILSFLNR